MPLSPGHSSLTRQRQSRNWSSPGFCCIIMQLSVVTEARAVITSHSTQARQRLACVISTKSPQKVGLTTMPGSTVRTKGPGNLLVGIFASSASYIIDSSKLRWVIQKQRKMLASGRVTFHRNAGMCSSLGDGSFEMTCVQPKLAIPMLPLL